MVAHAVQHDASRTPLRDRRDHIQRGGGQHAPYAVAHEAARRVPAADGGEDRKHDERNDQIIEELQREFRRFRRPVEKRAVIELLAVAHAQFGHHRMRPVTARRGQIRHQTVAVLQVHPVDALHHHIDAVAVLVDDVAVAVGTYPQRSFLAARNDARLGRTRLSVALLIDDQQQHVGEIDDQTDGQRHQQIENQVGIFRLQPHPPFTPPL
jgi:hypothetical protein